jgi:hypothetical protein
MSSEEHANPTPSREFKSVFNYLFRHEADVRTAIPITGVMRMGWGWSFIIDDFFRLFSEYARISDRSGALELTEESAAQIGADLQSNDEGRREKAQMFLRWLTVLEKQLPLLLNMSPRAHEIARILVNKVAVPEMRYTITESTESRAPFWGQYVGVERPPEEGGGRPKPPRIFRGGSGGGGEE